MQCQMCHGARYIMVTETPLPNQYTAWEKIVCPTCRGKGEVNCVTCHDRGTVEIPKQFIPCPDCQGYGDMPCCDGEDRWQPDKMDRIDRAKD